MKRVSAGRELEGYVAIVTGSARNIGRAIALELADAGATIAVHARTSRPDGEKVVREIEERGGKAKLFLAELTDPKAVASLIESVKSVKRSGTKELPQTVVSAMFRTAKDAAGSADGKDGAERYVFKVTDITAPAYNAESPEAKKISDAFKSAIADELLSQYVTKVESELGSTINRAALNQALTTTGSGN